MKLYSLNADDKPLVEVSADVPAWWPVQPRLSRFWLRQVVAAALARILRRAPVVRT